MHVFMILSLKYSSRIQAFSSLNRLKLRKQYHVLFFSVYSGKCMGCYKSQSHLLKRQFSPGAAFLLRQRKCESRFPHKYVSDGCCIVHFSMVLGYFCSRESYIPLLAYLLIFLGVTVNKTRLNIPFPKQIHQCLFLLDMPSQKKTCLFFLVSVSFGNSVSWMQTPQVCMRTHA